MSSTNFNFFQVFSALSASFPQPPPFDDFVRVPRPTPSCQALFLLFLISAIIYTNVIFCGLPFGQNACYHRVEYYLLNIDDTRFSMIAFLSNLTAGSTVLWVGRILLFLAAAWVVARCAISLFGSREAPEVWGFVSLANGARYDLTHWENMVGRMRSADVRLNFPSVSRCHAAICRNDQGHWWVYPVNRSSGVLLNGARTTDKAEIKAGDCIAAGGVEMYFFPSSESDEARLARRRTEEQERRRISQAGTLLGVNLCQLLLFLQVFLAAKAEARAAIGVAFGSLMLLSWALYGVYRAARRTAYELESLVFLLISVGAAVTAAYDPSALYKQLITVVMGMLLFLLMSGVLRNLHASMRARWPVAIAAAALLAFNVVLGQRIFGAKNWIAIGSLSFQPSELVKIAFILAGAATLDRLFAKRNLIFTILFSAYCVGCLALMSDFGTALIFFVAFLCIAFLRTGDLPSIAMLTAAAAFGCGIILRFKPYIADRFAAWLHAWEHAQDIGYQQTRTMSAMASGGLFGAGAEKAWLKYVGAANTDLVFGVVGEEFGFLLALCCVAALVIPIVYALRCAATARSAFYTILSCATAAMLVCQLALNVLGAVDLLPLTGVTFPFVSMGGSSMISCWGLMAYLKAADTRQNASFALRFVAPAPKKSAAPRPKVKQEGFFADRPDIPVDEIFKKENRK